MITESKKEALKIISQNLKGQNINWCLVGSTNLALQGIKVNPRDIDIATDREGAHKINGILKDYELKELRFVDKGVITAFFAVFKINNEEIEVVGETEERNVYLPLTKNDIIEISIGDEQIPCRKLEKEYESYKKLERPEKIKLIKQKLENLS